MLHLINNGLAKGLLFLGAGNVASGVREPQTAPKTYGVLRPRAVRAGCSWSGLFAVTGSPPFGPFLSEFTVLERCVRGRAAVRSRRASSFLLVVIFIGMADGSSTWYRGAPGRLPAEPDGIPYGLVGGPPVLASAWSCCWACTSRPHSPACWRDRYACGELRWSRAYGRPVPTRRAQESSGARRGPRSPVGDQQGGSDETVRRRSGTAGG